MQRILYAADFSARDKASFRQACALALAWNAKLLIAHVDDTESGGATHAKELHENLFEIFPHDLEIDYDHILKTGDPARVILDIEDENDVDLIVLGTHGRQGVDRAFAGSVAEQVIRSARCPVLTLRHQDSKNPYEKSPLPTKILVPTDFSVHSYTALDFASTLAKSIGARVSILHVDETSEIPVKQLMRSETEKNADWNELWQQLKKTKPSDPHVRYGHKMLAGLAADEIVRYSTEQKYDYIVLGTHGRMGIGRALIGSVAEKVVRQAPCAVITVKPSNKRNQVFQIHH